LQSSVGVDDIELGLDGGDDAAAAAHVHITNITLQRDALAHGRINGTIKKSHFSNALPNCKLQVLYKTIIRVYSADIVKHTVKLN